MPTQNTSKILLIGALITLVISYAGSYIVSRYIPRGYTIQDKTLSRNVPQDVIFSPTPIPTPSIFTILYQAPDDKEGRTIIYVTPNKYLYNNSGFQQSPSGLPYIVGIFVGWEDISGTSDRLIILKNPIDKKDISSVRVVFRPSNLFQKKIKTTRMMVENINKVKEQIIDQVNFVKLGSEDYRFVREIQKIPPQELLKIIKPGDAVVISPLAEFKTNYNWDIKQDEQKNLVAWYILLRRYNGAEDLK